MKNPLFRSIRHKLLNEGKLLRYLSYAVGEVVLIIVGILMALKINDWNENRKAQVEFGAYVVQLREDISQAISIAEGREAIAEQRAEQAMTVFRGIQRPALNQEEREAFEAALDMLDQFFFAEIGIGHLGQVINGNLEGIAQDKNLSRRIMQITEQLGARLRIIGELSELSNYCRETIVTYRGRPHSRYPEMKLAYDMDILRTSDEFQYLTQRFVYIYASVQTNYERVRKILGDLLTVFEEYE